MQPHESDAQLISVSLAGDRQAFGASAFESWAMGVLACGGGAVAWTAAFGGLAVAHDYAVGGLAIAAHANDEAARSFMSRSNFLSAASAAMKHPRWLVLLALLPLVFGWLQARRRRNQACGKSNCSTVLLAALLAIGSQQRLVAKPASVDSVTLTNGLRIVAVHFPGSTNVAIFTYLPMGLSSDGLRQTQWSHLIEHLVIRSTVPADSPTANAETLPDHMRLDFYGHTNNWKDGLKHTTDWLRGVPFTEANLDAEKPKVNAECDFTVKNLATHKFALAAWAQGYRHDQKHASVRGDVTRATLAEIQRYRDDRLVVLSNTLVCVVGGLDPRPALNAFSAKLSDLRSDTRPVARAEVQPGNREMTWDLDARHLVITWPIPAMDNPDYAALLTASRCLNIKFSSDPELKKLAGMIFAGADLGTPEGNFFFVSASLRTDTSFESVRGRIDGHVQTFASGKDILSLTSRIGKQLAESLTTLPDPGAMTANFPPTMTTAMLEMNIGLQWGMNEFRYGVQKASLARRLRTIESSRVADAARIYLSAARASAIRLIPNR